MASSVPLTVTGGLDVESATTQGSQRISFLLLSPLRYLPRRAPGLIEDLRVRSYHADANRL